MSKIIASAAISGAYKIVKNAEDQMENGDGKMGR